MLMWHKELWLIDHGAAFYFHHSWPNVIEQAKKPFMQVKDHVLLPQAGELETVDITFKAILTPEYIEQLVSLIPTEWLLTEGSPFNSAEEHRQVYAQFFNTRIKHSEIFIREAENARKALI